MHSTITMLTTYVFTTITIVLIGLTQGQQWGTDLGTSINNIVEQSLAPLRNMNLTPIINEEYERALNNSRHRYNYNGPGYNYSYRNPGYGYGYGSPGYGYSYNYSYPGHDYHYSYQYPGRQTTVVRNFWKDFNDKLEADLEPVRNLQRLIALKSGFDGYTIVKYKPSNRSFLIRDNILYECTGSLSLDNGQCSADLKRFEIKQNNDDYCFLNNKIIYNNYYCFVPKNAGYIVNVVNGNVICKSHDINEPAFLISADDYRKLCENLANSADYIYFPNDNVNTDNLACTGEHPKKCTYSENSRIDQSQQIIINS